MRTGNTEGDWHGLWQMARSLRSLYGVWPAHYARSMAYGPLATLALWLMAPSPPAISHKPYAISQLKGINQLPGKDLLAGDKPTLLLIKLLA